jgi:CRP/FNR family transcriptional regulator, cyclic AMP receptor protein
VSPGSPDLSQFNRFLKTFRKGDIIFCEYEPGDTFYLIQSGRVQIVRIIGELEKNIDVLYPGDTFGEMAILEEAPRSATTIALDDVKALEFNRENLDVLMMGRPEIAMKLLKQFIKRIYDQKRRFTILTLPDAEAKVADVFLMLAENQGVDISSGEAVDLKTTVDDMAHWAGIPTGQCREVLNRFMAQRRIEIHPDRIRVKNINDFARFVGSRRKQQERDR